MSNYIVNRVYSAQVNRFVDVRVRKRKGETYRQRASRVSDIACLSARHFALRIDGQWELYHVSGPRLVRGGLTLAAAEMWLIHQAEAHG